MTHNAANAKRKSNPAITYAEKMTTHYAANAKRTSNPAITYAEKMQLALTCSSFNWVQAPDWRISKASEYLSAATYL